MYFSIDTQIHLKIIKLCDDLFDEFRSFSKKYPYVSNIGGKNLAFFSKSNEWGLCQEIDEILRCYPHSPNFYEPSIDHSLNSLCIIKTFLTHTNNQSPLLEKTRLCWDESIELIKHIGDTWEETISGFDNFKFNPQKIYHEWAIKDDLKALYIYLYGKEYLPFTYDQIAEEIGVYAFNLNMRVLSFKRSSYCDSYQISYQSTDVFTSHSCSKQPELLFSAYEIQMKD